MRPTQGIPNINLLLCIPLLTTCFITYLSIRAISLQIFCCTPYRTKQLLHPHKDQTNCAPSPPPPSPYATPMPFTCLSYIYTNYPSLWKPNYFVWILGGATHRILTAVYLTIHMTLTIAFLSDIILSLKW